MRVIRVLLLALVAACIVSLTTVAPALAADTVTIDAVDSGGTSVWQPPNVSITPGDTVRWEFDQTANTHSVTSSSVNWSVEETRAPGGAAVEHTFASAGTYTFLCRFHSGMTGTVTVADDPLDKVLVFSKTAGFRHDS